MAEWATPADTGFRIATDGLTFAGSPLKGGRSASIEKTIEREVIRSEENDTPYARPVDLIDCRAVARFSNREDTVSESAAKNDFVINFKTAAGAAGSFTVGDLVAMGYILTVDEKIGGHHIEQAFVLEGAQLDESVVV